MASHLTDVAIKSRKTIKYGFYFFILFMVGRFLFGVGLSVYRMINPPKDPKPTVAFGPLTTIPFPQKENIPELKYKLETIDGRLPAFSKSDPENPQARVYYMPRQTSDLLSDEGAKAQARGLGYTLEPEEVSPTVFRFRHSQFPSTLEINIVTGVFTVSYDLAADPVPITRIPPTPEVAAGVGRNFLSQARSNKEDLTGDPFHEFLFVNNQGITKVPSLSEANLVKVNLTRKKYNDLPAVTANPNQSNVWFIISGDTSRGRQVIASEFQYFPIDEEQVATYPIKTAESAWQELQSGGGYIADLGQNQDGNIVIRRVYLAYYDPNQYTEFYQPVIVFEGDRNFFAYVPAVTAPYYGQ